MDDVRIPAPSPDAAQRLISRRALLGGLAGLGVTAAAGGGGYALLQRGAPGPVDPALVARVEAARPRTGTTRSVSLVVQKADVDIGGRVVPALTYSGQVPGPAVRATAGDVLKVDIRNELTQDTSVHWHGLAIRHDADGVPGVTGPAIAPGTTSSVEFVVPDPGTYWLHPHVGLQLDWGLYAPMVVDATDDPGDYDDELVVVLDDWTTGLGATPEQLLADLVQAGQSAEGSGMEGMGGMGGMHGGGQSDAGDVTYPAYLANGRLPAAPTSLRSAPGRRVRLRIINAAADTVFDVALAGHRLTVTHSDGFPLRPVTVDTIRLAMGERYDAVVRLGDGVFPLTAVPVAKAGTPARVLVRTGSGEVPSPDLLPAELQGRFLALPDLSPLDEVRLPDREPDTTQDLVLSGSMAPYVWTINGRTYDRTRPLTVRSGQTTRVRVLNMSMMSHPLHLHGHTFAVRSGDGARKDTLLIPAMGRVLIDVRADNPGQWMLHCHNAYHMEAGMMTRLDYVT